MLSRISIFSIIFLMPIDFVNIIVLIVAACLAFLFFYLQRKNPDHITTTDTRYEEKSYDLLASASKKAQTILSTAELDAIKLTSDTRFYKEKLEKEFAAEIQNLSKISEEEFAKHLQEIKSSLEKSTKEFENYLSFLKTESDAQKNNNAEMIKQQISQTFVKFEENLSQYLINTQQRSLQSIELELKATRGLIETYKQQQLKIINENIIAMLEKTLSLVLAKKMCL